MKVGEFMSVNCPWCLMACTQLNVKSSTGLHQVKICHEKRERGYHVEQETGWMDGI